MLNNENDIKNLIKFTNKSVILNGKTYEYILLNNEEYIYEENNSASAFKFWLSKLNGDKLEKHYLFKSNFSEEWLDNVFETLYSRIGKQINFPVAQNQTATYFDGINYRTGIVSKNYIVNNLEEHPFQTIGQYYIKHTNRNNEPGTDVNSYMKIIKYYAKNNLKLEKTDNASFNKIETDLKKIVILDYLLGQKDRYPRNLAILFDKNKSRYSMKLAPLYDNGFTHLGTLPPKEIVDLVNNKLISMFNLNSNKLLDILVDRTDDALSISKTVSYHDIKGNYIEKLENKDINKKLDYHEDIAQSIISNRDLLEFYINIINNVDITEHLEKEQEFEPRLSNEIIEVVQMFYDKRVEKLQSYMDKKLKNSKEFFNNMLNNDKIK